MDASPTALLRALITDAVIDRASVANGRIRICVVGKDEERFVVDLGARSRVIDDDTGAADATLWVRRDDVARLAHGFNLGGVRSAGRADLVDALARLLTPGQSPLDVRLGSR